MSQNSYYFISLCCQLFSVPFSINRTSRKEYVSVLLCVIGNVPYPMGRAVSLQTGRSGVRFPT